MDEKQETARRIVQTVQQGKKREGSPPSFSPSVRRYGENVNQTSDSTSGLRHTQAALDIAKSKMRQDADTPESGALQTIKDDSKTASTAATEIMRSIVRKSSVRKLNKRNMEQAELSDYTRHTARPIKKRDERKTASSTHEPQEAATRHSQIVRQGTAEQIRQSEAIRQTQATIQKNAVKSAAAKKGAGTAASASTKAAAAATKTAQATASSFGKIAGAGVFAIPILIILIIVAIVLIIMLSPLGTFFSGNEDNPNPVNEIVSTVNSEYSAELAALRKQYEDQGYVVNVYYGIPDGDDGEKMNNWRDVITLYSLHKSDGELGTQVYSDTDVANIRSLYFDMNPMSVDVWTETVEVEVEKEVETTKTVYNPKTGKFEKITTTEKVKEIETQVIEHADIWITNMRYVSKLDQYALNEQQIADAEFMLSYEHDPLWLALGITSNLSDGDYIGNVDDLIKNLPAGTKGTAIAQAALSRLGDPYSMDLRGQGRYIDCSGLTQWAYGLAGISLPNTAADQAKWCVDNGKIIDRSTAVAGDLIFYTSNSARVSNRFMKIGHVGIYCGDGMMVDASSSKGCVVYRAVYGSPVLWARPHV